MEREDVYNDLKDLIEIGYLTHNLIVNGVPLVLRSLFPAEAREISLQTYGQPFFQYRKYFVVRSIFSVRGVVLTERFLSPEILELFDSFPKKLINRLFYEARSLLYRYSSCFVLVESFSFQPSSRTLWFSSGRKIPQNSFGLENGLQSLWQVFNHYEDLRDDYEQHWGNTKFLGSALSPKGVKKIYQKDKTAKAEEKSRRAKVTQEAIARYTGTYVAPTEEEQAKPILVSAKTEEELMAEYHRWVRGEKDRHDLMVEKYKNDIRNRMAEQEIQHKKRMEELTEKEERGVFASTSLAPATIEQLEAAGFKKGIRTLKGESQRNRLYNRYLDGEEVHGNFFVGADGKVQIRK